MSAPKSVPARAARWWQEIVCGAQGHDLIGIALPERGLLCQPRKSTPWTPC